MVGSEVRGRFSFGGVKGQVPCHAPSNFFKGVRGRMLRHARTREFGERREVGLVVKTTLTVTTIVLKILFFPVSRPITRRLPSPSLVISASLSSSCSSALSHCVRSVSSRRLTK